MKISLLILFISIFILTGCVSQKKQIKPEQPVSSGSVVEVAPEKNEEAQTGKMYDLSTMTIKALGTEPFWNFVASGTTLTWNQPNASGTIDTNTYTGIIATQTPTTVTLTDSGLNAFLTLQACSDGMSENAYTHKAIVTKGVDVYDGCATITP